MSYYMQIPKQRMTRNRFLNMGVRVISYLYICIFLSSAVLLLYSCKKNEESTVEKDVSVRVQGLRITRAPLISTISLTGFLRSDRTSTLVTEISSTVLKTQLTEGAIIKKDDILLLLDDESLVLARDSARYQSANARLQLETTEELFGQGLASHAQLQQVQSAFFGAESFYKQQVLLLKKSVIRAPFSGSLVEVNEALTEGTSVGPGTFVAQVADLAQPRIESRVSDFFLEKIRVNDVVSITFTENQKFSGYVSEIGQYVSPRTGTFDLVILFEDTNSIPPYKLGQVVDIELILSSTGSTDPFLIPRSVVREDAKGEYVYIENDSLIYKMYVDLGEEFAGRAELKHVQGIDIQTLEGQALVITGLRTLIQGQAVSVQIIGNSSEF